MRRAKRWWWRTESSGDRCDESGRCTEEIITHTNIIYKHTARAERERERERFLYIVLARTPVVEVQVRRPRESSAAEVRAKI